MRHLRKPGLGLLGAIALSAVLTPSALAGEYNLHARPEIGRCVLVGRGGEFRGNRCTHSEPGHGKYNWFSGPGAKPHFTSTFSFFQLKAGATVILCKTATSQGEYTGPKNLKVAKLVLTGCERNVSGIEALCQNEAGSTNGEITFKELEGELAYISHPKHLKVGWDLKAASGANLATFECGGANETLGKSLGTGTTRELQGSVIGRAELLNKPTGEVAVAYETKGGAQLPEHFEGGVKDTLTTLVGSGKTPAATTLEGRDPLKGEEALEILAKCGGTGC
jgi:hypothetical protein